MQSTDGLEPPEPTPLAPPAVPAPAYRLPARHTSLIGRQREIADAVALLRAPAIRLVTLTGPGGVGKTRLAIQVAVNLEVEFPDGVAFIRLAAIRDPELVAPAMAQMLGVHGSAQEPALSALKYALIHRHELIVLDNFEHVIDAAPLVVELLQTCPHLRFLITSRTLLNVTGEHAYPVPQLSLDAPPGGAFAGASRLFSRSDASQLFVERARAVNPSVDLSEASDKAIAEIVKRLDGLPLAIELAAARGALFSPIALLNRLDQRLPLLTGGPRDQPARHQTMYGAIAWSYELLTPEEQRVFRCLGLFVGGCTLDAAEEVCAPEHAPEDLVGDAWSPSVISPVPIIETIESLTRQSLIRVIASPAADGIEGTTRISMLETIREFSVEQRTRHDDVNSGRRHAHYYLDLATRAEPSYWGDEPGNWRSVIELEEGNLQAALNWAIETGESDLALRLAGARFDPHVGGNFHWTTGSGAQSQRPCVRRALALPGGSPISRTRALIAAAWLADIHDDFAEGKSLALEALASARSHDDAFGIAGASFVLGAAAFHEGDIFAARPYLNDALAGFQSLNARGRSAWTLNYLASLDSRDAIDEGGNADELARAASLFEEALVAFQEVGHIHGIARVLHGRAYVAYKQRDLPRALTLTQHVLALDWERRWPVYYYLEDIADIAGRIGYPEAAARLYGAAETQRERAGRPLEPVYRAEFERDVEVARSALDEWTFREAWETGRGFTPEEAVAEAMNITLLRLDPDFTSTSGVDFDLEIDPQTLFEPDARQVAGWASPLTRSLEEPPTRNPAPNELSPRELEVLRSLMEGHTDREIAEAFSISRRTVSKHVEGIFDKLGVRTRVAAVAEAHRRGVISEQFD